MKLRYIIAGAAMFGMTIASAQQINPVTQAMLDGYERLLETNPDDYFTLFERSSQYFRLSKYDEALSDIKHAIEVTPAKEIDQLAAEYELAAEILIQQKDYEKALQMSEKATELMPNSYPLLYQKGNIQLYLNRPAEAKKCFQAMQRLKSRSQDAIFGLAKASVLEGNDADARNYMDQAEKLDPSNYVTYCRLGDLYADMGEPQNAAANYLSAFSLSSGKERPLTSLLRLASGNYAAVTEALDYALDKTSNTVPLLFLRGNIAKANGHNREAYTAYKKLLTTPEGNDPIVLATLASMSLTQNEPNEALGFIERSISASPSADKTLTKAQIEYALKDYTQSLNLLSGLLQGQNADYQVLRTAALDQIALGQYADALQTLNLAVMAEADNLEALLLRGYINANALAGANPSTADYERVNRMQPRSLYESTLKAISQMLSGKKLDADATIAEVEQNASTDPDAAYLMAMFCAQTGNKEKGAEYLAKARSLGYDDMYQLELFDAPLISIAPLR